MSPTSPGRAVRRPTSPCVYVYAKRKGKVGWQEDQWKGWEGHGPTHRDLRLVGGLHSRREGQHKAEKSSGNGAHHVSRRKTRSEMPWAVWIGDHDKRCVGRSKAEEGLSLLTEPMSDYLDHMQSEQAHARAQRPIIHPHKGLSSTPPETMMGGEQRGCTHESRPLRGSAKHANPPHRPKTSRGAR